MKKTALYVIGAHCFLLLCLLCHHCWTRELRPARPIIVKHIDPLPPTAPPLSKSPKKAAASATKKQPAASPKKKSPSPLSPPNQIKSPPPKPTLSIPAPLSSSPREKPPSPSDISYEEALILHLQSQLDLPEQGEVKAKLEIDRYGNVLMCEILHAKSAKNAEFLRKELPLLSLPCFNEFQISEITQSFTITFCNVETH